MYIRINYVKEINVILNFDSLVFDLQLLSNFIGYLQ